jgi:DNA topoisomerase-3
MATTTKRPASEASASRWLVLTEKPSVSGDIAKALGDFQKLGEYYESKQYVVTWAVGHLLELLSPEEIDAKYKRWLLQDLPIIPDGFSYKPKSGQEQRIKAIKALFSRTDVCGVINACDAGREGELIFREIYDFCGRGLPTKRLWLQSMTPDSIRREFQKLRDGHEFDHLGSAARCRAESDWLIGMNGTRALTRRLRPRTQRGVSWSVGRVQTPTLGLLVAREMEILKHRPEDYWVLEGRFSTPSHEYSGAWFDPSFKKGAETEDDAAQRDDRIVDRQRLQGIMDRVMAGASSAQARETRKTSREGAPQLFDLTTLQRESNRRFGMSASRTLQAAQRLYEKHKMLTYPRTDSRYLPVEYRKVTKDLLERLRAGDGAPHPLAKFAAGLLKDGLQNESRVFDDAKVSDHFAIIPTGVFDAAHLEGDDARVFDLVLRRFLSAFMDSAVWAKVERITTVAGENFRTRVQDLEKPGWREVYGVEGDDETKLPPLVVGEPNGESAVSFMDLTSEAKQTRPPARFSEARLLSLMESCGKSVENGDVAEALLEKGIGTPATRADIIENLIAKEYIVRAGRGLRATAKGIRLLDVLSRVPVAGLSSVELTGEMEYDLKRMERGQGSRQDFMRKMVEYTRDIVEKARSFDYDAIYAGEGPLGLCPMHPESQVRETFWAYKCEQKECGLLIWKEKNGRYVDRSLVADALRLAASGKAVGPVEFHNSAGLPFEAFVRIEGNSLVMCDADGQVTEAARGADAVVVHEEFLGTSHLGQPGRFYETETTYFFEFGVTAADKGPVDDADSETQDDATPVAPKGKKKPAAKAKTAAKAKPKKRLMSRMPKVLCGYPMPREEFLRFIQQGHTSAITEFKSKKGRPFAAALHLKDNGNFEFKFESRKKLTQQTEGGGEADGGDESATKGRRSAKAASGTRPKARAKAKVVRKTPPGA